ncbi:hypothetical protein HCA61_18440 [Rhodococcus sp. HNM0563]|uniref:hypothetical protein n=1 Tax=Rhodococcus sp. HNM0563 TaxID=2716339 RepID=UPI00146B51B1|nr:hypothetical protein [Rhodococcus sp. HNM0563]NLU64229.1 hypothetical protein [Rhodococcus sp. HNM0563]
MRSTLAIKDCCHLSQRLERELIAAGEQAVLVPSEAQAMVHNCPDLSPIDTLAVVRAALHEPGLSDAHLDGVECEIRLMVDHRQEPRG